MIGGVCGLAVGCIFWLDHISSRKSTVDVVPDVAEWASGPKPTAEPAAPDQEVVLDADKQKQIWDAEHATFEIESQLGPLLLKAIEKQDVEQLTQHCRPDFKGTLPSEFTLVERHKPPLSEWSLPSEFKSAESHAPETMAWLVQQNKNLQKIERRRLRVLKIENQTTDASLWKCRFLVTFSGRDKDGGYRLVETENLVSVRFSTKQELTTSPVLESWAVMSQTERLCTHSMMQEITEASGLSALPIPDNWNLPHTKVTQYRFQIAVEDFDRDGDMDIAAATTGGERFVLVNDGKAVFSNQTSQLGLPQQDPVKANLKFMSVWFDYDNDGYPDLLSGAQLFHNEEGKRFTDVTRESGLSFDPETMGATVADYDSDGLLDLYATSGFLSFDRKKPDG